MSDKDLLELLTSIEEKTERCNSALVLVIIMLAVVVTFLCLGGLPW